MEFIERMNHKSQAKQVVSIMVILVFFNEYNLVFVFYFYHLVNIILLCSFYKCCFIL